MYGLRSMPASADLIYYYASCIVLDGQHNDCAVILLFRRHTAQIFALLSSSSNLNCKDMIFRSKGSGSDSNIVTGGSGTGRRLQEGSQDGIVRDDGERKVMLRSSK